jgi:hypothetical protein
MVNRKKNQRHSARVSFAPHRKRTKDSLTGRSIKMAKRVLCVLAHLSLFSENKGKMMRVLINACEVRA